MVRTFFKRPKIFLVLTIISSLLLGISPAMAADKVADTQDNLYKSLLYSSAYTEVVRLDGQQADTKAEKEKTFEKIQQDYKALDNATLKQIAHDNLKIVVEKQKNGSRIFWNKDFVEKVIKTELPDIYQEISQLPDQTASSQSTPVTAQYTPGQWETTWWNYGYNAFGVELFGLACKMSWKWDSSKITSVTPSTWGECYVSGWNFSKFTYNRQSYGTGNTSFRKEIEGEFKITLSDFTIQSAYLWHDITIYPGGGDSWDYGSR